MIAYAASPKFYRSSDSLSRPVPSVKIRTQNNFTGSTTRRCRRDRVDFSLGDSLGSNGQLYRGGLPRAEGGAVALRPGRNPYKNPRKSASSIQLSTSTAARWTILSSNAGNASLNGDLSIEAETSTVDRNPKDRR